MVNVNIFCNKKLCKTHCCQNQLLNALKLHIVDIVGDSLPYLDAINMANGYFTYTWESEWEARWAEPPNI